MTFNEYQEIAKQTAVYPNIGNNFIYPTLGLAGESGEVAEKVKKIIRDNNGIVDQERKKELAKELGDVLWYLSQIATEIGVPFEEVASLNIEKLRSRYDRDKIKGSGDNR